MSKKSNYRIESKKKKAAAFIQLIKTDEGYLKAKKEEKSNMPAEGSSSDTSNKQNTAGGSGEKSLADEMFAEYKKMMRERQKAAMMKPKIFLTLDELIRDDPVQTDLEEVKVPPPLFMADIQHLLLYGLQGKDASIKPRWCRLLRVGKVCKVVAVVLDSLSSEEFKKYPESLPTLSQAFDLHVEMISPIQYGSSAREDIMNVPISITQLKKKGLLEKKDTFKNGGQRIVKNAKSSEVKQAWDVAKAVNSLAENPLEFFDSETPGLKRKRSDDGTDEACKRLKTDNSEIAYKSESTYELDNYDRRWLMLNTAQMICEGIPMPASTGNNRYKTFVFSKREYKEVTEKSPLFAVDCEMVQTKASGMDLARVSFVDENLQVVYDTFVKPWAPVTNYVTRFSGITKEILDPVRTRIQDVQRVIQTYLPPDAILCGQSICSDLSSMKIFHPYVIDTSVIYNLTGNRNMKAGLKRLSSIFLRKGIQEGMEGHSSVEDAQATMELVLLKLRNSIEFGDISMLEPGLSDSVNDNVAESPIATDNVDGDDDNDGGGSIDKSIEVNSKCSNTTEVTLDNDSASKHVDNDNGDKKLIIAKTETEKDKNKNDNGESTADSCECSNLTKTITVKSENSADTWKRRLFFQNEGSKFMENFIVRIRNNRLLRRDGVIIDEPSSLNLYPKDLPIITCKKDKERERQTLDKLKDVGFCFTHLYGYRNYLKEKGNLSQSETSNLNGSQKPDQSEYSKEIKAEENNQSGESTVDDSESDSQSEASNSKERKASDQSDDEAEIKKCLWKLDRRFWKILMGLPSNSLFVVILPGREENGKIHSAMTFAKIT